MGFNTTIEKVKKYVIVTNDFKLANFTILQPDVLKTYFYKSLGKALVDEIEAFEGETNDTPKKQAFDLLENSLAKLVIDKYLTKGQVMIDNAQITRVETDTTKTAYKAQIKDSKEMYFEEAFSIFDLLLDLIISEPATFTTWNDAPIKADQSKLLIKTASNFNEIERLHRKNLTFYALIPTQKNCIDLYLRSRFTAPLVAEIIANASLSPEKAQVREYFMTAIANFTIATGMKKNQVMFSADGISLLLHDEITASELKSKADIASVKSQIDSYFDTAHRYVDLAEKYIASVEDEITTEDTTPFVKTQPWL